MTTAVYNLERRWEIPAYVWPAVLGSSVAVHLAVLSLGLSNMAPPEMPPEDRIETELVLETGGLKYEAVSAVKAAAPSLSGSLAQSVPLSESEPLIPNSTSATAVQTDSVAESELVSIEPQDEIENFTHPETVQNLQEPGTEPVVTPTPLTSEIAVEIEAVEVQTTTSSPLTQEVEPEAAANTDVSPSTQQVTSIESTVAEAVVVAVEVEPLAETQVTDLATEVTSQTDSSASVVEQVIGAEQAVDDAIVPITVLENAATVVEETVAPQASIVSEASPIVLPSVEPVAETPVLQPVSPVTTSTGQDLIEEELNVTETLQTETEASAVVTAEQVAPLSNQTIEPAVEIDPVEQEVLATETAEQKIAEVVSEEIETAALSQANPQTLNSTQPEPDTAESVPAVQVASIDPMAKVSAYVTNYNIGDCAHLTVTEAGADNASVTAFGAGITAFQRFDERFKADQGYSADIELRLVSTRQCALLDAIGTSQGIEAAGLVDLDRSVVRSGSSVSGVIQRDLPLGKIAAANEAGLGLDGKGPPEIYLIDGAGQIHDGRNYLLPASNSYTAGGWRFSVPVTLKSSDAQETALVLAIWNRPEPRQPPRFGTLPSGRIAGLLSEPGVYSLAAFKVSR